MAAGMARPRVAAKVPQNIAVTSDPSCRLNPEGTPGFYLSGTLIGPFINLSNIQPMRV